MAEEPSTICWVFLAIPVKWNTPWNGLRARSLVLIHSRLPTLWAWVGHISSHMYDWGPDRGGSVWAEMWTPLCSDLTGVVLGELLHLSEPHFSFYKTDQCYIPMGLERALQTLTFIFFQSSLYQALLLWISWWARKKPSQFMQDLQFNWEP